MILVKYVKHFKNGEERHNVYKVDNSNLETSFAHISETHNTLALNTLEKEKTISEMLRIILNNITQFNKRVDEQMKIRKMSQQEKIVYIMSNAKKSKVITEKIKNSETFGF